MWKVTTIDLVRDAVAFPALARFRSLVRNDWNVGSTQIRSTIVYFSGTATGTASRTSNLALDRGCSSRSL